MLEKIDLKNIFTACRQSGSLITSLYAERRVEKSLEFSGRQQRCQVQIEEGSRLELQGESSSKVLTSESISTSDLLKLLGHASCQEASGSRPHPSPSDSTGLLDLVAERNRLEQVIRKAPFDLDSVPAPTVCYVEVTRDFLTSREGARTGLGQDSYAQIEARFQIGDRPITISRCGHDIRKFRQRIESDPLFLDPGFKKGWDNPWPAPQGKLPILWSQQSVSKLLFPFLRAFEASKVDQRRSLLSDWTKPIPLKFDLSDRPDSALGAVDHAGHLKSHQRLITKGLPSGLLLGTAATGLSRRMHYLGSETQGFWNISLESEFRKEKLLDDLQMGIYAHDLTVERFDPSTGEAVITLSNSSLLHNGSVGEALLPVTMKCSLLELFSSWEMFSTNATAFGYWNSKAGVRFITEITAPEAFSREFFVPGTVSPSHYW